MLKSPGCRNLPARKSHQGLWAMLEVVSCWADLLEVLPGARKDSPFPRSSDICWLKRRQKLNFQTLAVVCSPSSDCRPSQMIRDSVVTSQCKMPWDTWNYWQMSWTASIPGLHRDFVLNVNPCCSVSFRWGCNRPLSSSCCKGSPWSSLDSAGYACGLTARLPCKKDPLLPTQIFCERFCRWSAWSRVCGRAVDSTGGFRGW